MIIKNTFTIAQAAERLGVSRAAIFRAIREKRLKAKKGAFYVERIVKTKMTGWVIAADALKAYQVSAPHQEAGKKND